MLSKNIIRGSMVHILFICSITLMHTISFTMEDSAASKKQRRKSTKIVSVVSFEKQSDNSPQKSSRRSSDSCPKKKISISPRANTALKQSSSADGVSSDTTHKSTDLDAPIQKRTSQMTTSDIRLHASNPELTTTSTLTFVLPVRRIS